MADKRPRRTVRSSAHADYSDRDGLLEQMAAHDKQTAEYNAAAKEQNDLANSERLAKAELLRKTGLAAFVTKRCEERGFKFKYKGIWIDDVGALRGDCIYHVIGIDGKNCPDHAEAIQKLKAILEDTGIPKDSIKTWLRYEHTVNEQGKILTEHSLPSESIYIPVDESVITGLIEKETEKRLAPIQRKFEEAAARTRQDLQGVAQLIESATGHASVNENPERDMGFSREEQERVRADVRRKVTTELLGQELTKSAGQEKDLGA